MTTIIGCAIEGITALICNSFTDAAAEQASSGTRGSSAGGDRGTPLEIAQSKLYRGADGKTLIIPQPNLLRSIVDGGQFHKIGRSKVTTQKSSLLYACLDIEGSEIPIVHKQPWKVDTRACRIPATGGRILVHRPMFDDWRLEFIIRLETHICGIKLLRQIVNDAGTRIGLGDYRPSTKGPYGRYSVVKWNVVTDEQQDELSEAA